VLPLGARPLHSDGEGALLEVDVAPAQPERFALPQSESDRNDPPRRVASLQRGGEELGDLCAIERLDLLLIEPGRLGDESRVLGQVPALHRLVERRSDRAMDLMCSRC